MKRVSKKRAAVVADESPAPPPPVSAPGLKWFGWTDRGKVRANDEDSFLGLRFDAREAQRLGKFGTSSLAEADFVFAVSDGMGGAKAGEYASQIAVDKITTRLPRSFRKLTAGSAADAAAVSAALADKRTAVQILNTPCPYLLKKQPSVAKKLSASCARWARAKKMPDFQ